ncbi:unnamed protein product [Fusarium venenatum]|uniref:BZIP domain-containing protein n=1 Tax=Fusarium venenatum TaxID=56646 RepID=A0A2L2T986_9HYPO|nr:uncharacterized protein FVRRES_03070 [Fusarium venenatum]CEI66558.1 unnamed protein product [Fusarium venenatum]
MIASLSSSPPTSMPYSTSPDSHIYNTDNMVRSSSAEPAKSSKRKGTRSVSTLTPSQLARKRANDREAQRAIRARTKEHIDRLERELEELKSKQSRDQTVQELLRRNQALEEELMRLKENMGVSMTSSPYSAPGTTLSVTIPCSVPSPTSNGILTAPSVYDDNLSSGSGAVPSPRGSPFPSGDYSPIPDYGHQYVPLPTNCESWANTVSCPVPSNVSSPSSSADDYSAGYIPTSVPTSLLPSNNTSSSSIGAIGHSHKDVIKMEYEDVDSHVSRRRIPPQQPFNAARFPPHLHGSAAAARLEHVSRLLPPGSVLGSLKDQNQPGACWPVPVLTTPPACRFDQLLVGFLQDCRRMATAESLAHTLGPTRIDVRSVFRSHDSQLACSPHPITDLIRSLIDTAGMTRLMERIAIFAPLQTMICWLAQPTPERRARLCDDYAPRECQLTTPHPQWLDLVHWGSLREATIERQDLYATEEFQRIYFDSLRLVNWSYQPLESLVTDSQTGHVGLTDALTAHAMNGSNWRLNETFTQRYPELSGLVALEHSHP